MLKEKVSLVAILANLVLFIVKLVVGILSRSSAVLADAVNSASDVFASGINYLGIKIAKKPVDKEHPYGHHKYEVLVGFIITIIIFLSGLYIIYKSILGFFNPEIIQMSALAMIIMLFSASVNEIMARIKTYAGKKENSIALLADATHSRIDVMTSLVVLVGLIVSNYWVHADSLAALLVGFWVLKESISLGKEVTDELLDVSAGDEKENKIKKILKQKNITLSNLKTQKRGGKFSANLTISLSNNLKVDEATKITDNLRQILLSNIPDLDYVVISIKGTDTRTNFYRGFSLGKGYGWKSQAKNNKAIVPGRTQNRTQGGPVRYCLCSSCGYKVEHERGVPCSTIKCPKCGLLMRGSVDGK